MYYDKWWKNHGHTKEGACTDKYHLDSMKANALGVVNIGGIFVVLICGLSFAIMVAIMEFCWSSSTSTDLGGNNEPSSSSGRKRRRPRRREDRISLCKELAQSFTLDSIGGNIGGGIENRRRNSSRVRSSSGHGDCINCNNNSSLRHL